MLARTSLYQCGGAFGFRDQLQDAESLALFEPSALREMINKACAAQFEGGDVLHWWHDGKNGEKLGVRTRCGDDLLWLAHAVCLYVRLTEDTAFLSENIPFVHGQPLADGEYERFSTYARSDVCATVYEHCLACLHAALKIGEHGLILFGTGDWNDGMNAVGFFFCSCGQLFSPHLFSVIFPPSQRKRAMTKPFRFVCKTQFLLPERLRPTRGTELIISEVFMTTERPWARTAVRWIFSFSLLRRSAAVLTAPASKPR